MSITAGAIILRRQQSSYDGAAIFLRRFCTSFSEHMSFVKDVAPTSCPEHLPNLLNMLRKKGDFIISPGDKQGMFPLAIPLSRNPSGVAISLLQWPTAPPGMDMPVVEVHKYGVSPLAKNVDQYIHRLLVEEDVGSPTGGNKELFRASDNAGKKLYSEGNFKESQMPNLDTYLLRKMLSNARLINISRKEIIPNNRGVLYKETTLSWIWTACCIQCRNSPEEVAEIAEWKDEQIYYIKNKLSEEGKQVDLHKGKELAQIALDEAAYLLDLASVEGAWDDFVDRIAECYKVAGLNGMARFITYKG
ncbi:protein IN CHLOROPLAST ATPASE BIOGENESIS, chloroplastic-like isoform X2 [Silene latifolia]|uniref:protein IN CHLOROPLAST ATPASE BIOGENESIS, chloroplastic-like isoform X2 n=1 Tax=Silene latifolia TaxID=37657 RepID=UPI003D776933